MANSHATFKQIDACYRSHVAYVGMVNPTYKQFAYKDRKLLNDVIRMHRQFEILMRTLVKYLEAKREYFPRLYFLSNE